MCLKLQAQSLTADLIKKVVPQNVTFSASPVVTVEPRPRKFHQPITVTIPLPQGSSLRDSGKSKGSSDSLRLLCSFSGNIVTHHAIYSSVNTQRNQFRSSEVNIILLSLFGSIVCIERLVLAGC